MKWRLSISFEMERILFQCGRPAHHSVADPKFNHFIFQQDGKLFELWYLDAFAKLLDQVGTGINVAHIHKYVRSMALNHFGVNALKEKLLPQFEEMVHETLHNWSCQASVDVQYASTTDRKKAMNMIRKVLKQRLASPQQHHGDILDHVIQDMNALDFLTMDFVVQLFFGLLFGLSDSISKMTTLTLKLLNDYPDVLQELIVEHEAIVTKREKAGSSITWDEFKSMTFTLQVINEVLRLGNASPGLFRRTLTDIQVNDYTIPAGWPIMIATSALHLNSEIFNDPLAFNPWRWKEDSKSTEMSKNFMPFGEGMKQCAGAEYTRVFLAFFIHVLVTKYRWTKIMEGEIFRNPIGFRKGLHIKVMEKHR